VEIHPEDAEKLGLSAGTWCEVSTPRGKVEARVFPLATVGKGNLFLPMHYDGVNRLTAKSFDPYSRQPSFKYATATVIAANRI
jgi:assimilatory nitrate reductase catalytic subunit